MSMLPEEFPVVLTVFMAMGAWRISRARVLTRRAAAIETLGSATVLCTDKTGTLTQNRMAIAELRPAGGEALRLSDAAASARSRLPSNVDRIRRPRQRPRAVRSDGEGVPRCLRQSCSRPAAPRCSRPRARPRLWSSPRPARGDSGVEDGRGARAHCCGQGRPGGHRAAVSPRSRAEPRGERLGQGDGRSRAPGPWRGSRVVSRRPAAGFAARILVRVPRAGGPRRPVARRACRRRSENADRRAFGSS